MSDQETTALWSAPFQATPLVLAGIQKNVRFFWNSQTETLDRMQTFSEGWFERRRAATEAALELCENMCNAKTPIEWFGAYQQWLTGANQRLIADGLACQSELKRLSESLAPSVVPAADQERSVKEEPKRSVRA